LQTLSITRPDDWHVHLRDGALLAAVVPDTARRFRRAIAMPNLRPPVTTTAAALAYRERILRARPPGSDFEPLMTLYLTEDTAPEEIARARASGRVHAVKLYPAGATTGAQAGVRDLRRVERVLEALQAHGLPLLVHAEVVDPDVDVFDREQVFIERHLVSLVERFPELRVVLEHASTAEGVAFVEGAGPRVAATLTPHHLLLNRNHLLAGGLHPHHYCLPVVKREDHRRALVAAATGGSPQFFLGTDSAPHPRAAKEGVRGAAGIYTAHAAIELYAEVFEAAGVLHRLEAFASHHGPDFYGLARNRATLTLERTGWTVPETRALEGGGTLCLFRGGGRVAWRLAGE